MPVGLTGLVLHHVSILAGLAEEERRTRTCFNKNSTVLESVLILILSVLVIMKLTSETFKLRALLPCYQLNHYSRQSSLVVVPFFLAICVLPATIYPSHVQISEANAHSFPCRVNHSRTAQKQIWKRIMVTRMMDEHRVVVTNQSVSFYIKPSKKVSQYQTVNDSESVQIQNTMSGVPCGPCVLLGGWQSLVDQVVAWHCTTSIVRKCQTVLTLSRYKCPARRCQIKTMNKNDPSWMLANWCIYRFELRAWIDLQTSTFMLHCVSSFNL